MFLETDRVAMLTSLAKNLADHDLQRRQNVAKAIEVRDEMREVAKRQHERTDEEDDHVPGL